MNSVLNSFNKSLPYEFSFTDHSKINYFVYFFSVFRGSSLLKLVYFVSLRPVDCVSFDVSEWPPSFMIMVAKFDLGGYFSVTQLNVKIQKTVIYACTVSWNPIWIIKSIERNKWGKVYPVTCHRNHRREVELWPSAFLTSTLNWNGWSTPRPNHFNTGYETQYPWYSLLVGLNSQSVRVWRKENVLRPPEFEPRFAQPVESRYKKAISERP